MTKAKEGTSFDTNIEGVLVTGAYTSSIFAGWSVGLGIPTDNIGLPTSSYYPQVQQVATAYPYDPRLVEQRHGVRRAGVNRDR